jgi:adenosine deaminase
VAEALSLSRAEIVTLAKNSFLGSFLSDGEKTGHLKAVEDYASPPGAPR